MNNSIIRNVIFSSTALFASLHATEKSNTNLTLLNVNTHWASGNETFINDPSEWKNRIAELAARIKNVNPDVVCLEEVFTTSEARDLKQALQSDYEHFYFQEEDEQFGSGLFIASKHPLDNPNFTPFETQASNCVLGFFDCTVTKDGQAKMHLYMTHLEPSPSYDRERVKQLEQLIEQIAEEQSQDTPSIISGDFSFESGKGESAEYLLNMYFEMSPSSPNKTLLLSESPEHQLHSTHLSNETYSGLLSTLELHHPRPTYAASTNANLPVLLCKNDSSKSSNEDRNLKLHMKSEADNKGNKTAAGGLDFGKNDSRVQGSVSGNVSKNGKGEISKSVKAEVTIGLW